MRWPWTRTTDPEHRSTLSQAEVETLGRYNAEKARGIRHAPEWQERMAELQRRFNYDAAHRP
jgi:hypothetical protein